MNAWEMIKALKELDDNYKDLDIHIENDCGLSQAIKVELREDFHPPIIVIRMENGVISWIEK